MTKDTPSTELGSGLRHPIRVLLVDDQPMIGEAIRRILLADPTMEYHYCADPTKAIQAILDFQPTVILQDLVMPEVDGLSMLRQYRANASTQAIPTIVLSTKEDPKVKAESFTLGAADYLVKLPDPIELLARIRMHSRGYIALLERNEAYVALKKSEERLAQEMREAANYLTSLLPERLEGELSTDWRFVPSAELGGDTFGYFWLDDDHFAMYLLDVCGHGLKAALLAISAMNVVRNRTLPETDFRSPAMVLNGMNQAFQMDRHDEMYFTMWYAVFDRRSRRLRYASAGHPPALILMGESSTAAELIELTRAGLVIGAFPNSNYAESAIELPSFSRLYFFSDGLYEVTRPDSSMLTFQEFKTILATAPRDRGGIPHAIDAIRAVRNSDTFEDDLSIVEVNL